jgi:hypothetical protein
MAWLEMSGIQVVKEEADYKNFTENQWNKSAQELQIEPQKL